MKTASKERQEELRRRVVVTASEMFKSLGYTRTSMRALAERLGVTPPFIYYYFKSKQDLLYACMQSGLVQLDIVSQSAIKANREDSREGFVAYVRTLARWQFSQGPNAEAPTAVNSESIASYMSPKHHREIMKMQRKALNRLKELIKQGQMDGKFDPVDPTVSAFAIIGIGAHMPRWAKAKGRLSLDEILDIHTELALRIVGAKASRAAKKKSAARGPKAGANAWGFLYSAENESAVGRGWEEHSRPTVY
jgi:AcrR family transcriptional regulator